MDQHRFTLTLLDQVEPYFETGMYEQVGITPKNGGADNRSDSSQNSYKSGHLYSER